MSTSVAPAAWKPEHMLAASLVGVLVLVVVPVEVGDEVAVIVAEVVAVVDGVGHVEHSTMHFSTSLGPKMA